MTVMPAELTGRRCVVLGAAGFIGRNLCTALHSLGARVVGLGRPDASIAAAEWHSVRLEDAAALDSLLQEGDVVFHLAGSTTPGSSVTAETDVRENVTPTLRMLDIATRKKIARVVYLSSGGTVYGPKVECPSREDAATDPISWYGVQKLAIEKYLSVYRRLHHLDFVALRVGNPFGPHQVKTHQGLVAAVIRRALADQPVEVFGSGQVVRDYVYVADVVDAIIRAAATTDPLAPRVYNIGSGVGRSVLDVIAAVEAVHGRPIRISRMPDRPVDVPINILDISRARKHLGWTPGTPWEDAIRLTYEWAQQTLPARG